MKISSFFRLPAILIMGFVLAVPTVGRAQAVITSIQRTGSTVVLKFRGTAGTLYGVEQSPSLLGNSWRDTGFSANGTGSEQTINLANQGSAGRRFFRLTATAPTPAGFVVIPAGNFRMGDQSTTSPAEGDPAERPVIEVPLGAFAMKSTEVTKGEWDVTLTYALANGYAFSNNSGLGRAASHPVHSVNWYDILKWCNARSAQDGLQPCYYVTGSLDLYRTGTPSGITWDTTKNGYRLPSEAEWEKAARGGAAAQRFPFGQNITHAQANYQSSTTYAYDTSPTIGFHPGYGVGALPYTAPAESFATNGYGLYNMAGNVREYCWDSGLGDYASGYAVNPASQSATFPRVVRGGDWSSEAFACRNAYRSMEFPDTGKKNYLGFRLAQGRL